MKDRRPPRKGGPKGGASNGPRAGFRQDKAGGGARQQDRPRKPREERGAESDTRRFDGPRPPRQPREGAREFDRRTERPTRSSQPEGGPGGRKPYGAKDDVRDSGRDGPRRFERKDDGQRRGRSATANEGAPERRFPPRGARRGDDARDASPQRDFKAGFERRPRNGGARDAARDANRIERRPDEATARSGRDHSVGRRDNANRDESYQGRRGPERDGRGGQHGAKPRPGAEQRIVGREKARRANSLGEDGALWLYGKHAVAAALANPKRKIKRLIAAEEALAWLASTGLAKERLDGAEQSSTDEIELLLHPGAVHQGLVALVEDLPRARLREECAPGEGLGPVVVLDQITDPQNIGAIMRSAAAFGATAVIVQDRRTPPLAGALAKAAAGAVEQIPCVKVVNIARAIEGLKDLGYYCAGLAGEAVEPISAIPKGRPIALVLGAEGEGLRRLVADTCDALYKIPIAATVDSLNVSTAAAISLFAVTR